MSGPNEKSPRMRRSVPAALLAAAAVLAATTACGGGTPAAAPAGSAPASSAPAPSSPPSPSSTPSVSADPSPSGGGIAGLDGDEIAARAKEAFGSAKTVHVKGNLSTGGQELAIDIRLAANGAVGSLSAGDGVLKLIRIGKVAYLGGDKAFWTKNGGAAAAKQLSGKYVKVPSTTAGFSQFIEFTDLTSWRKLVQPTGFVQKGRSATIRGVPALELTDAGGKDSLFVATEGKPYPLRLSGGAAASDGSLEFFEYGKDVPLSAPPSKDVIALP